MVKKRYFGKNGKGQEANLYTLENKNGMILEVTDFGATLYALIVPDKEEKPCDVLLAYEDPSGYEGPGGTFFGSVIGRSANRIGNATFSLNGKEYTLDRNKGIHNLHSGRDFYSFRIWEVQKVTEQSITLALHSPDGDQGYPGALDIAVTYTLTDENEVRIDYEAVPEADTIINLTNHAYFNLDGHASGDILNHQLWIDAKEYTRTDADSIPTGELVPVEGTPMDFRVKKMVGREIEEPYEALIFGNGYDHNWCLNQDGICKKIAELSGAVRGITMEVYTDLPGVQIYTGNYIPEEKGKGGVTYHRRQGICFETQYYPDAINHENFKSPIYRAGEKYCTTTIFKFL